MSIYDSSYCGSIWHHGIKGQKWGVRRTPEELGHISKSAGKVAKSEKPDTIVDGVYRSSKGFTVAAAKLGKFCLDPEKKHSKEFFDVGYKPGDSDLLFSHIEQGFDINKMIRERLNSDGARQFVIPMMLGVINRRLFTTAWQVDKDSDTPKLTSAYIDRRLKEGK